MTLLSVAGVAVRFGGEPLFTDITFQVERGERWGIIGRNGTGKTTLVHLLTGDHAPDAGAVSRAQGLRIAVMDQYRELGGTSTVWEAAARGFADLFELERDLGRQADALGAAGDQVTEAMLDRYAHDLDRFEHAGGYAAAARVDAVLAGLGFQPDDARTRQVSSLSGGERGRLALASQLAAPADLLILDEPTNHLDLATARWLEAYLHDIDEAVLVISHDRAFLNAVVDHVLHFEGGTATPYEGNYGRFVVQRAERRMALERAVRKQEARLAAEEDFIRRNIAGQKSKQAKGRRRRLDGVPRLSPPPDADGAMAVAFSAGERGGDQVLVADHVELRIGARVLLKPWSGVLRRGDTVGLIGSNGAGKSTLIKALVGERPLDGGAVRVMPSARVAYYRQDLSDVNPDETIYDLIAHRRPGWNRGQVQGHLGRFDFSGKAVMRRAGSLSGGERARVALALMMLNDANLLVFDEPTNHLDVESIEVLEDALENYEGTVLLVTHDRALLAALTTRIWSLDDGEMADYPGGFADWESEAPKRAAARTARQSRPRAAARPKAKPSATPAPSRPRLRIDPAAVATAEAAVAAQEAALADVERRLADPELYARSDGRAAAAALVTERDGARRALEEAMAAWESLAT
ncbi:MAG TPA: ABC-F family ATP-binding cassette domain-containing protein [Gemmatimonadales bacterium]|nr:ABC-F family ATP-binding cassette domain-containing protein [Gemmatimonadales bacterium]